jgi:hypothetical protein
MSNPFDPIHPSTPPVDYMSLGVSSMQELLEAIQTTLNDHILDSDNPHQVTAEQIGSARVIKNLDDLRLFARSEVDIPAGTLVRVLTHSFDYTEEGADLTRYASEALGGGYFVMITPGVRYSSDPLNDDNGSFVLGFQRVKEGTARPEWFGGKADGVYDPLTGSITGTDNMTAINDCVRVYGECRFGTGVYGVDQFFGLLPNGTRESGLPRPYIDCRWTGKPLNFFGEGASKTMVGYVDRKKSTGNWITMSGATAVYAGVPYLGKGALFFTPSYDDPTYSRPVQGIRIKDITINTNCGNRFIRLTSNYSSLPPSGVPNAFTKFWSAGTYQVSHGAIFLVGDDVVVEDVDVVHWGHGTHNVFEYVAVGVATYRDADSVIPEIRGPQIRNVRLLKYELADYSTQSGLGNGVSGPYVLSGATYVPAPFLIPPINAPFPEVNGFVVLAPQATGSDAYIKGAVIEGCQIVDVPMVRSTNMHGYDITQKAQPYAFHGITMYSTVGSTVKSNIFSRIDGLCIYGDSSVGNRDTVYRDNVFDRVTAAFSWFVSTAGTGQFVNQRILGNSIRLALDPTAEILPGRVSGRNYRGEVLGIHVYNERQPASALPFFTNFEASRNDISCQEDLLTLSGSHAFRIWGPPASFIGLRIYNNSLNWAAPHIPSCGATNRTCITLVGTGYTTEMRFADNRTPEGELAFPFVQETVNFSGTALFNSTGPAWEVTGTLGEDTVTWDEGAGELTIDGHESGTVESRSLETTSEHGVVAVLVESTSTTTKSVIVFVDGEGLIVPGNDARLLGISIGITVRRGWEYDPVDQSYLDHSFGAYSVQDLSDIAIIGRELVMPDLKSGVVYRIDGVEYLYDPFLIATDAALVGLDGYRPNDVLEADAGRLIPRGNAPLAHTHPQSESHDSVDTDSATTAIHHTLGTGANQAAAGNDARLSDARTPTAHNHAATEITSGVLAADRLGTGSGLQVVRRNAGNTALEFATISVGGGDMLGTNNLSELTDPAVAFAAIKQNATTSATGVVELATDGQTDSGVVVQGNDARLSNARTPTSHDHSSNKLAQANTHETPDTDSATTSLHHTLGTGANQAAAGTHVHTGVYDPAGSALATSDIQAFTTPGAITWNKPSGPPLDSRVTIRMYGGGGGGGGGRRGAAASVRCGGGAGSAGGYVEWTCRMSDLDASISGTVGAGGTAGAAASGDSADGGNATAGGNTSFGPLWSGGPVLTAGGGGYGRGGTNSSSTSGGANYTSQITCFSVTGSGTGDVGVEGSHSYSSGNSKIPSQGGSGGGITSGNVVSAGGKGGSPTLWINGRAQGTAGTASGGAGGAGSASPANTWVGGGGGGGGGSHDAGAGGAGGAGAAYGGGGGGGGASLNGNASGAGGAGGDGLIVVFVG